MARQRGFPVRNRSQRRNVAWVIGPNSVSQFITATGMTLWTTGTQLVTEDEVTVVRTRGILSLTLQAVASLGDGINGAIGIGIVSTPAFDIGVTAVPGPLAEVNWPGWLYHNFFDVRAATATIGDGVNSGGANLRMQIDSKAMRKFGIQETMVAVVEVVEQGTVTVEMNGDIRQLAKL